MPGIQEKMMSKKSVQHKSDLKVFIGCVTVIVIFGVIMFFTVWSVFPWVG